METSDKQNQVAKYMRIKENEKQEKEKKKAMWLDTSSANATILIHSKHSKNSSDMN